MFPSLFRRVPQRSAAVPPAVTRAEAIDALRRLYLEQHVEDPQDGTRFDCAVLDALEALEKEYADLPVGFV